MEQGPEKVENTAPSLAIDGSRIRSIREGKKLTQLYVASVVGVTTDTISRWENNRYPTIKRDNAEKLARALEVELGEIVRADQPSKMPESAPPAAPRRTPRLWILTAVVVLILVLAAATFLARRPAAVSTAVRWSPHFAAPGQIIPVQIKVTRRQDEMSGFILKERLPAGFQMYSSLPASSAADPSRSSIKWLVPGGSSSVLISYSVKVPASVPIGREVKISGEVVVRKGEATRTEAVAGDPIRIGAYHWADTNGDGRIDDDEIMPAYYVCEGMKGLGLDWKTIEDIWSGKGYRWDRNGFTVIK
ncbi:helix-turn-helix transcriptional regulator [Geomonas sp.]|uniref:helix-turn-helix transcriptional regulator n=1 Tax=Geomonas sp. TaxID=2651584 RepID=UPI002B490FFB|nr:helix-turn-helix transcriptional regulator [Geomonas sp.]HJV34195.1 helix-turn-helix transcriptional regulator [Geomonas sp.]